MRVKVQKRQAKGKGILHGGFSSTPGLHRPGFLFIFGA